MKSVILLSILVLGTAYACPPISNPVQCTVNDVVYTVSAEQCEKWGGYYVKTK